MSESCRNGRDILKKSENVSRRDRNKRSFLFLTDFLRSCKEKNV